MSLMLHFLIPSTGRLLDIGPGDLKMLNFVVFLHKMIHCGHNNTLVCFKLIYIYCLSIM